jgi:hypothetical protein
VCLYDVSVQPAAFARVGFQFNSDSMFLRISESVIVILPVRESHLAFRHLLGSLPSRRDQTCEVDSACTVPVYSKVRKAEAGVAEADEVGEMGDLTALASHADERSYPPWRNFRSGSHALETRSKRRRHLRHLFPSERRAIHREEHHGFWR